MRFLFIKVNHLLFLFSFKLYLQTFKYCQIKRRWEDMTGNVKKKEREARNKELNRLRVTGNGHLEDEVG